LFNKIIKDYNSHEITATVVNAIKYL